MEHDVEFDKWRGTLNLPEFRHVKIKRPGRKPPARKIKLSVRADDEGPTKAQAAAFTYLLDNQEKVLNSCFRGITRTAKRMRGIFEKAKWVEPEQLDEMLPKSPTADTLRTRVEPYEVRVTDRVKGGVAFIEYDFSCAWDGEHGLLIVLHRDRLVYSGLSGDGW